jgi:hypothetical protein
MREDFDPGKGNVKYTPLVAPQFVLLPPLHIKLDLIRTSEIFGQK